MDSTIWLFPTSQVPYLGVFSSVAAGSYLVREILISSSRTVTGSQAEEIGPLTQCVLRWHVWLAFNTVKHAATHLLATAPEKNRAIKRVGGSIRWWKPTTLKQVLFLVAPGCPDRE